jgi:hypothetical protein
MAKTHEGSGDLKQSAEPRRETGSDANATQQARVELGHYPPAIDDAEPAAVKTAVAGYLELSNQTYTLLVDAYAAVSRRKLDYVKALYEVAARPYASTAVEQIVRENFDRTDQALSLTIAELQTSIAKTAELSNNWLEQAAKIQESTLEASRNLVKASVSNLAFVKKSGDAQLEAFAKRVEEAQNRAGAGGS